MKSSPPQAKILVIDDDPDFLKLTTLMLQSAPHPYIVVTASSPQEGKEKLFEEKPDLVLLDIMMDSLFDGFSLCNDIKTSKEYEEFKDTPIIFVSAVKKDAGSRFLFDQGEQGLRGPDDYLDKPVQPDILIARIEKLLNK
jgi:CheY-like chemotaxis protein